MQKSIRLLKYLYYANAALIVVYSILFFPLGILVAFLSYAIFAWPIFISFQVLNIILAVKEKQYRPIFIVVSIIIGLINIIYGWSSIEWWLAGAPMP